MRRIFLLDWCVLEVPLSRLEMDDWGDDWEEYAQSSKPKGKGSKTFDGLEDIVDDYDAQSSMPKTKKLKKAETRRAKSKQAPKPMGNPPSSASCESR